MLAGNSLKMYAGVGFEKSLTLETCTMKGKKMLRHLSWETGAFTVTLNTRLLYWYAASKQAKVRKFEMLMRWTCTESKFLTDLWIQDFFKIYYVMNSDPDMLEQENLQYLGNLL